MFSLGKRQKTVYRMNSALQKRYSRPFSFLLRYCSRFCSLTFHVRCRRRRRRLLCDMKTSGTTQTPSTCKLGRFYDCSENRFDVAIFVCQLLLFIYCVPRARVDFSIYNIYMSTRLSCTLACICMRVRACMRACLPIFFLLTLLHVMVCLVYI